MASASDLNALMSSLSFWEIAGYVSLSAVALGVAGEFIHDFAVSIRQRSAWWASWGGQISGLVLIAALAGELLTQIETNSKSGQIIAFLSDQEAETRKRAATLENEAAEANERTAEIMRAAAWRQFTPHQLDTIKNLLSQHSGKLLIGWVMNDTEATYLAIQFSTLFERDDLKVKWDAAPWVRTFPEFVIWGIHIPDASGAQFTVDILRRAFSDAEIPFVAAPMPPWEGIGTGAADSELGKRALVFFGSKQPTFGHPPF